MRVGGVIALVGVVAALVVPGAAAVNINTDVVLPDAEVNGPYEFVFEAFEGCAPYHFSITAGTLPPGFRLRGDGRLLGSGERAGTYTFTVSVKDLSPDCPSEAASGDFTLDVLPDLAITTPSLPGGRIGVPYTASLAVSGRDETAMRWTIVDGGLPPGLRLEQDGVISGTPTGAGTARFAVTIEEPFRRKDLKLLSIAIESELAASPPSSRVGEVGRPFSATLVQTRGVTPVRWVAAEGSLPLGLVLDRTTGEISGWPFRAGTSRVTFEATDASGTKARTTVDLRMVPRLQIKPARLSASVGSSFTARARARGGVGQIRWTIARGTLPRGLRFDAAGRFSGTPRAAGTYLLEVKATDRFGVASTATLTLTVGR